MFPKALSIADLSDTVVPISLAGSNAVMGAVVTGSGITMFCPSGFRKL
jgi:hypothetical protein